MIGMEAEREVAEAGGEKEQTYRTTRLQTGGSCIHYGQATFSLALSWY